MSHSVVFGCPGWTGLYTGVLPQRVVKMHLCFKSKVGLSSLGKAGGSSISLQAAHLRHPFMFAQLCFFQGTKREKEMGTLPGHFFWRSNWMQWLPSLFFSRKSLYVAQAVLKTMIFLSLLPESQDYRHVTAFFEVFCANTRTPCSWEAFLMFFGVLR